MNQARRLLPISIFVLLVGACALPEIISSGQPGGPKPETAGAGSFDLMSPTTGLDGLSSYQAVLQLTFDGTRNGEAYKTSRLLELGVDRDAGLRTLRETNEGADSAVDGYYMATIGNLVYLQELQGDSCDAAELEDPTAPLFEPASMLPAFRGGVEAGAETLIGGLAKIYTFDAAALNAGSEATASGKVWIADPGGWVMKFELTLEAGADIFGEGMSGTQVWEYSLNDVNLAFVELASACPILLSGLPEPEDAGDLERLPGMLSFTTAQTADALGTFYTSQLTAMGWSSHGELIEASGTAHWLFSRMEREGEQVLLVLAEPQESGFLVRLIQIETSAPAQ